MLGCKSTQIVGVILVQKSTEKKGGITSINSFSIKVNNCVDYLIFI